MWDIGQRNKKKMYFNIPMLLEWDLSATIKEVHLADFYIEKQWKRSATVSDMEKQTNKSFSCQFA